ncbi:MAG: acyltransferase [Pseudobutyrivibrio sp.]|nr:acyltransferase [Pseudobutyrivibrio sp.]
MILSKEKIARMPQFDLLRIVAILIIFNYHFCIDMGLDMGENPSIFCSYKNGGWGSVGTCIFFILSGYMIHMTSKNVAVGKYLKKRFLSIYPPLWICFFIAYAIYGAIRNNYFWAGHPARIILSLMGIDTYVMFYGIPTYALVGEWFTGMIIFLYVAYILLRVLMKKAPVITTIIIAVLYFAEAMVGIQPVLVPDASVFTGLALFWLGMLFQENNSWLEFGIIKTILAVIAAALVLFVPLPYIGNVLPWKNLLGISLFYLLINIFSIISYGDTSKKVLKYFSGISFIIYLIHHFVIFRVTENDMVFSTPIMITYIIALSTTIVSAIIIDRIWAGIKRIKI